MIALILILAGFILAGASAFTSSYSRWWGVRGGRLATFVLRALLGVPIWFSGYVLAWMAPGPFLFKPVLGYKLIGTVLIISGLTPFIQGYIGLRWKTHMPSIKDTLVRSGLYAYMRHPIYAGVFLIFGGFALIRPTPIFLTGCILGVVWLNIQARLEEIDLLERMPEYRNYMKEVPRFIPRLRKWHNTY